MKMTSNGRRPQNINSGISQQNAQILNLSLDDQIAFTISSNDVDLQWKTTSGKKMTSKHAECDFRVLREKLEELKGILECGSAKPSLFCIIPVTRQYDYWGMSLGKSNR